MDQFHLIMLSIVFLLSAKSYGQEAITDKVLSNTDFEISVSESQPIKGIAFSSNNEEIVQISSSNDFAKFYGLLCDGNTFSGKTIVLTKDISFETGGKIGNRIFEGIFDGQGYKINDITSSLLTTNRGEIRNLHIASGSSRQSGIFCTNNYGSIINCKNSASINFSSSSNEGIGIGGLCDSNYGQILNCINEGSLTIELVAIYGSWSKATSECGGICKYSGKGSSIVNCNNTGNIKNSGIYFAITGGIVATAENSLIVGCKNNGLVYSYILNSSPSKGNVTVESYQHQHVGGIAGHVLYCVINRCKNYGTVKSNFQYLGGIAGYVGNSDVYNLENFGDLEGYEGYGFHSVSGIIPYFKNPYKRQHFINCINHGNITVFARFGVATGAGISAEIENAYIANCYSNGSVSSTNTGNMSASFQIPQYECENSKELNNGISNADDANAFISTFDSPETLLRWIYNDVLTLKDDYFAYPIAQHGNCQIFVYPDGSDRKYLLKISEISSQKSFSTISSSPIESRGLSPDADYCFEVLSEDGTQLLDKGKFKTLRPNVSLNTTFIGYDNIEFSHSCDAKGVDKIEANLFFYSDEQDYKTILVQDSTINISNLDEETNYFAELVYSINGIECKSNKINVITRAIVPQFSLISQSPYSLTLKCDNYEDIKNFIPALHVENPRYYGFGECIIGESRDYELDEEGFVTIDSLLYGYTPEIFGKYTINGENRFRECETKFSTLNWGGEGIIQLSPNAAMIHGLFGGMGSIVGGFYDRYDRARFYYRDATASDDVSESYRDGVCIDNGLDYAVTIPINSFLFQYYISLQYSRYTDPKNSAKDGEWQIIDARNPTIDIVEPRFYNARFENQNIKCSCIEGEERISSKFLQYKVEETNDFNTITLSNQQGTEALSKTLNSIVPQLSYIIRFGCVTDNGKKYYSSYYRLFNNKLDLIEDYDDSILISELSLNKESISLTIGESFQLIASVLPKNATETKLSWVSSDETIATIDQAGFVTAVANGEAIITVSSINNPNITATCRIIVRTLITDIILNENKLTLKKGEFKELIATVLPENATNAALLWTSSDASIVSVQNGLVLAHKIGSAVIRVEATDDSGVFVECNVEVTDENNSIKNATTDGIYINTESFSIFVHGLTHGSIVKVIDINGHVIYSGTDSRIDVGQHGVYLVVVKNKVIKIKI